MEHKKLKKNKSEKVLSTNLKEKKLDPKEEIN